MQQMNNSAVGRVLCETGGYLRRKLWMSLFVSFLMQAAGSTSSGSTFDMTSLWNVFHDITHTLS